MKNAQWIVVGALLAVLVGCGDDTTAEEPAPVGAAPAATPTAEQIPVPEDFEERAQTEVTDQNYRDQLAGIEAEVAAD